MVEDVLGDASLAVAARLLLLDQRIVHARPLEVEENEPGGGRRDPLHHVLLGDLEDVVAEHAELGERGAWTRLRELVADEAAHGLGHAVEAEAVLVVVDDAYGPCGAGVGAPCHDEAVAAGGDAGAHYKVRCAARLRQEPPASRQPRRPPASAAERLVDVRRPFRRGVRQAVPGHRSKPPKPPIPGRLRAPPTWRPSVAVAGGPWTRRPRTRRASVAAAWRWGLTRRRPRWWGRRGLRGSSPPAPLRRW